MFKGGGVARPSTFVAPAYTEGAPLFSRSVRKGGNDEADIMSFSYPAIYVTMSK